MDPFTGSHVTHLGTDMRKTLKAVYTLAEQLYTGAQRVICTASNNHPPPSLIKETLEKLSMMPPRIVELKKSAARSGALTALTRAKAWISDLDPEDVGNGYPSQKEDGSEFNNDDLRAITREMRPLASKLAEDTNLSIYQNVYATTTKLSFKPYQDNC